MRRSHLLRALAVALALPLAPRASNAQEDLRVLRRPGDGGMMMKYTDAGNSLYHHLAAEVFRHAEERADSVASVATTEQWRARRASVRQALLDAIGPFPERTPLDVRITGVTRLDGFRIERLIYHSRPDFPVTAALFIPDGITTPRPGILYASGHGDASFRSPVYLHVILNLVKKGFVVLAFDPVGQGERFEYPDSVVGALGGHAVPGVQLFLTGGSLAREMIWDGIRGIDYLTSRPEVDAGRIGVTGRSGGGTLTAYLGAIDPRVLAAAPENYLTSFRRLWETRGPQDPEQHFLNGIARGLDHADLVVARAPKPTLMVTTTRDIFSIQGARESYQEAKRAFTALGAPDALAMVEDDSTHASTLANREATYAFLQQALSFPGDPRDLSTAPLPAEALRVTETGQVATSLHPETSFSLNLRDAEALAGTRGRLSPPDAEYASRTIAAAKRLSGYRDPDAVERPLFMGRNRREGYSIEKYVLRGEGDYPIPYLLFLPDDDRPHPAVVYLDPAGKGNGAGRHGPIEDLVRQGFVVLAPDLLGVGEMAPTDFQSGAANPRAITWLWFGGLSVGRSIAGLRAADVVRLVRAIRTRPDILPGGVRGVAFGEAGSVLLHAAAFDPGISAVALIHPLVSYSNLVATRFYQPRFTSGGVAAMLTEYDLPDLAATLAPRPLLVLGAVDATGRPLAPESVRAEWSPASARYSGVRRAHAIQIVPSSASEEESELLARWLADPAGGG